MKIIAVTNIKRGVGKTTTAVNPAYLCAAAGQRTLLWDLLAGECDVPELIVVSAPGTVTGVLAERGGNAHLCRTVARDVGADGNALARRAFGRIASLGDMWLSHGSGVHSQGFRTSTPIGSKSRTLRVTTVMWWTEAVAAIKASRMGLGSGTCNLAQRSATAASTGSIRPSNSDNTRVSIHARRMAP